MKTSSNQKEVKKLVSQLKSGDAIFGIQNFGNTCYCNSVLQSLYHTQQFRQAVIDHGKYTKKNKISVEPVRNSMDDDFQCLEDDRNRKSSGAVSKGKALKDKVRSKKVAITVLDEFLRFMMEASAGRKSVHILKPSNLYDTVRNDNIIFAQRMQHDAHEFLSYLITSFDETVERMYRLKDESNSESPVQTWVKDIFEGKMITETKCLCCETKRRMDENFLDLKMDVENNTSLMYAMGKFFEAETLKGMNKFQCEHCSSLQEAEKRIYISKLPKVFVIHLKRFKYVEHMQNFTKIPFRLAFPFTLRMQPEFCSDELEDKERLYELVGLIVHIGSGPNHGHYISMNKINNRWLCFDDDRVSEVSKDDVMSTFGTTRAEDYHPRTAYILFFQEMA